MTKLHVRELLASMLEAQRIDADTLAAVETAKAMVEAHRESGYTRAFNVAKQAATLFDFEQASEQLAEINRTDTGTRDRVVSVAISSIKNYWTTCDAYLGETLVLGKGKRQMTITLPKKSNQLPDVFESFSQWRRVADHIKKLDKDAVALHDMEVSAKWVKAKQLLADVTEDRAHAILDRMLADLLGDGYTKKESKATKAD